MVAPRYGGPSLWRPSLWQPLAIAALRYGVPRYGGPSLWWPLAMAALHNGGPTHHHQRDIHKLTKLLCSTSLHQAWRTCIFVRRTSRLEQFTRGRPY